MGRRIHSQNNLSKIKKRIFKNLAYIAIGVLLVIIFWGLWLIGNCSIVDSTTTRVYGTEIKFEVCSVDEGSEEFIEAENLVKDFMGNDYISPIAVNYVNIYSDTEIFGFQQYRCIYIKANMNREKIIQTMVHELLHLQNEVGFDITIDDVIIGHNFTEAVVEKITCILTSSSPTKRVQLLEKFTDSSEFIEAFRNKEGEEEWSKRFSSDELYEFELKYKDQSYSVEKYIVFLNNFDNGMVGVEEEF